MNLIDEENVAGVELGENADEIGSLGQRRTVGHMQLRAHFIGDHVRQCCFAQARRAVQERVLHGFLPAARGFDRDL